MLVLRFSRESPKQKSQYVDGVALLRSPPFEWAVDVLPDDDDSLLADCDEATVLLVEAVVSVPSGVAFESLPDNFVEEADTAAEAAAAADDEPEAAPPALFESPSSDRSGVKTGIAGSTPISPPAIDAVELLPPAAPSDEAPTADDAAGIPDSEDDEPHVDGDGGGNSECDGELAAAFAADDAD